MTMTPDDIATATVVLLAMLVVAVGWLVVEVRKVSDIVEPLATSPVANIVAQLGR